MTEQRVLFVCGSPRRARSASRVTAEYLARFLDFDHEWLDVAGLKLTADPSEADAGFTHALQRLQAADAVVFVFGAWSLFTPIELQRLFEKLLVHPEHRLQGKLAAAVMTSVRVADDATLERVRLVSEGLGLAYLGDVSANGNPFFGYTDEEQTEQSCRQLAGQLNRALADGFRPARRTARLEPRALSPLWRGEALPIAGPEVAKTGTRPIVIVSGHRLADSPAAASVAEGVRRWSKNPVEVVEVAAHEVRPCTGCYQCIFQAEGRCTQRDDYEAIATRLSQAAGVVLVGVCSASTVDAPLKALLDRSFSVAHRPTWQGKQALSVAVGGDTLEPETALLLQRAAQTRGAHGVAALAPSCDAPERFVAALRRAVEDLDRALDEGWNDAERFTTRSVRKLFRDLAAQNGMILRADYRYYRERGGFPKVSDGGAQVLLRLLFRSRRLEKLMLEAQQRSTAARCEKRLQSLLAQGVRPGTGQRIAEPGPAI
ncbi:MAG: NAD(P)H-dependent oxidoreductase [Myxococcales bacterium]